jgi:hypothetical protein
VQTNQLIAAHWKYPITWNVILVGAPQMDPTETGALLISWDIVIGAGQSQTRIFPFALGPLSIFPGPTPTGLVSEGMWWAGPSGDPFVGLPLYQPLIATFQIPAQDIQITAHPSNGFLSAPANTDSVTVGAYVAPITEPHALQLMQDIMGEHQGDRKGGWMGPGFTPEPLGYRR